MKVGIIKGNGIGPEIVQATQLVLEATSLQFEWIPIPIADEGLKQYGHPLPSEAVNLLKEIKLAIKAPLIVNKLQGRLACRQPDGSEIVYPSLNNAIRRELKLFVNPRPIRGISGLSEPHHNLDTIIMREITEDVYIGWEHRIGDHAAQAIKLTTREAATRLARYAFEYAKSNQRSKVTCIHKANVLNYTDGLFLECCRSVASKYPEIEFDDLMIDAACFHIVKQPELFDVVAAPNQYGDIFSDLCAGLAGSLGLAPGANIGDDTAVFEASHGAAPDIAGKGIANPIALILSGALLLRYAGYAREAGLIESATYSVLEKGELLTPDLGGTAGTMEVASAIAHAVREPVIA